MKRPAGPRLRGKQVQRCAARPTANVRHRVARVQVGLDETSERRRLQGLYFRGIRSRHELEGVALVVGDGAELGRLAEQLVNHAEVHLRRALPAELPASLQCTAGLAGISVIIAH
jgi:hypothetical protein